MEFTDVLANNEFMEGTWQINKPPSPQSDFYKILEIVQKALPIGYEELFKNSYERFFAELLYQHYTLKKSNSFFIVREPLIVKAFYGTWGFINDKGFTFQDTDLPAKPDIIQFTQINYRQSISMEMRNAVKAFSMTKIPSTYKQSGLLGFLIDMVWWGRSCIINNPDSIGEGDQSFDTWINYVAIESLIEKEGKKSKFANEFLFTFAFNFG